jgi:hypothetical protein
MGFLRTKHASEIYYGWGNDRRRMCQKYPHRRRTIFKETASQLFTKIRYLLLLVTTRKKYDRFNRVKTLRSPGLSCSVGKGKLKVY